MPVTSRRRPSHLSASGSGTRARRGGAATAVLIAMLTVLAGAAAAEPPGTVQLEKDPLAVVAGPLATGPEGDVWFTSGSKSEIGRVSTAGAFSGFSSGFPAATVPYFISRGADGNMWFTDSHNRSIDRITPSGVVTPFTAGLDSEAFPSVPTEGPEGDIWFTDSGPLSAIGQITPAGTITEHTAKLRPHASLVDLTEGPEGNIWFTDNGEENLAAPAVGKLTPGGEYTEYSEGLRPDSNLGEIVAGAEGNLWALDGGTTNSILKITPSGTITEYTEGLPAGGYPEAITAGADGNMWVTYNENAGEHGYMLRVSSAGVITPFPFPLSNDRPFESAQIAAGADGRVWVSGIAEYAPEKVGSYLGSVATGPPSGQVAPTISGPGEPGAVEQCEGGSWASWNGSTPSLSAYSFDGYSWLLNGTPIVGADSQNYTPTAAEAGQQISCRATATYPLPSVTEVADSATVKLGGEVPAPAPIVSGDLEVLPEHLYSAQGAECVGAKWSTSNVETQWLLDGAPIAGATTTAFVPPRTDDGRQLSCRQTGTPASGPTGTLTSASRTVYEQPPAPRETHLVCAAGGTCFRGDGLSPPYLHNGAWTLAAQISCGSEPWTSTAGDSLLPALRALAEPHTIRLTLDRVSGASVTRVAYEQLSNLQIQHTEPGWPSAPIIEIFYGSERFTSAEVLARALSSAAIGEADPFAAGQGSVGYALTGLSARGFEIVYTLTAADLGTHFRCVVEADDGPVSSPSTGVRIVETTISRNAICRPVAIAPGDDPYPEYVENGNLREACLSGSAGVIGAAVPRPAQNLPIAGAQADVVFHCTLPAGCNGTLRLTGPAGKAAAAGKSSAHGIQLARLPIRLRRGAGRLFKLHLDASARRLLRHAGSKGLSATLTLTVSGHKHTLARLNLVLGRDSEIKNK